MTGEAWRDSATNEVLYPDELPGRGPVTVVSPPMPAEEADTDDAEYGLLGALHESHDADYVVAPVELREELAERWDDDAGHATIEVVEAEKGPADDDPWQFEFIHPEAPHEDG